MVCKDVLDASPRARAPMRHNGQMGSVSRVRKKCLAPGPPHTAEPLRDGRRRRAEAPERDAVSVMRADHWVAALSISRPSNVAYEPESLVTVIVWTPAGSGPLL
jgi:hypothetical protein